MTGKSKQPVFEYGFVELLIIAFACSFKNFAVESIDWKLNRIRRKARRKDFYELA